MLSKGLGLETGCGVHAGDVCGGVDMVVEVVGGQDGENETVWGISPQKPILSVCAWYCLAIKNAGWGA